MSSGERLVKLLADGALHSGERLADALGVSRTAIWKVAADLRARGIPVVSLARRGYKLERPVELLDVAQLRAAAARQCRELPVDTEVVFELGSTNDFLYGAPSPPPGRPRVVFTELQTAGRGRRGRTWLAPFGACLTFSLGWTFEETPADLSALSLAMGVCVARALRQLGAPHVMLKWPNDIVVNHCKLGGLLAQLRAEAGGPVFVVVGLGLNLRLPESARSALLDPAITPVTDLVEAWVGAAPTRIEVAACVAAEMLAGLAAFARSGFPAFAAEWARLDSLRDEPVIVQRHDGSVAGVARGAAADGALLLQSGDAMRCVHAGEVSLRRAPARAAS